MKKIFKYSLVILGALVIALVIYLSFFSINVRNNEKTNYYALANYMQNFNKKAVALLIKDENYYKTSDEVILAKILKENIDINEAFKGYRYKMKHDTDETILILGDEKKLLLEDASRTPEFDHHYHESQEIRVFDFTMQLQN